ncbi:helix-turn-helix domain-containing protein [Nocardioides sp. J54]|uniref:helix-turn-helix domain-containing protein n=1 Tax=Nocardioides sp. J54 TaxID=935866 RepID=UPI0018DC9627|nr:helix-turn-helix domain-containing protein [Nocardioides sp. J54]
MARRSKLDWMKDLRGADLTPAEFKVLVILATYTDKNMLNAHPGTKRLVEDTGLARSTVIAALGVLQERGWIRMTEQGGNQFGKGIANVYSIHTPTRLHKGPIQSDVIHKETDDRTLKGPTGLSLVASEGSDSQAKGPMIGHQGSDSQAVKGLVNRTPSGHASGPRSGPSIHHSAGSPAGARPAGAPRPADPWQYDDDGCLTEDSYDHLIDTLDPLDDTELNTIDGMLADGRHPQAVINTITKRRASA